jgi:DoxX-like family
MKAKTLAYWATTVVLSAELIAGGVLDLAHERSVVVTLAHLGYPSYLLYIVGCWRLLAAAALLAPRLPRLKEWAYAGSFFELTGAALSSLAVGDSLGNVLTPGLFAACAIASWALRPQSRMLGVLSPASIRVWYRSHDG